MGTDIEPVQHDDEHLPVVPETEPKAVNLYVGISSQPVSDAARKKLMAPVVQDEVEIRPDGIVYLSEIKYRRILNDAFGPGGWAMMPHSKPEIQGNIIMREFGLYIGGRFAACAVGEKEYHESNPNQSYATAHESAKSNALMRCCKDLGISSELWDRAFIDVWRGKYAVEVWCENIGRGRDAGKKKRLWRKRDQAPLDYPWKETGAVQGDRRVVQEAAPRRGDPPRQVHEEASNGCISPGQQRKLFATIRDAGWAEDHFRGYLKEVHGLDSTGKIPASSFSALLKVIEEGPGAYKAVANDEPPKDDESALPF